MLPEIPDAPSGLGALANAPTLLAFWRMYDALALMFGNPAAAALSYCARDSSIRTAAIATSMFSLATRCSSAVSVGSLNKVHQFGSIGASTVTLTGAGGGFAPNQPPGPLQLGAVKFGPERRAGAQCEQRKGAPDRNHAPGLHDAARSRKRCPPGCCPIFFRTRPMPRLLAPSACPRLPSPLCFPYLLPPCAARTSTVNRRCP